METKTGDYPFVNIYKAHAWQPCAKTVCGAVRENRSPDPASGLGFGANSWCIFEQNT